MELKLLRTFLTVTEQSHFSRAADVLHMSQPALSKQIGALEASLGGKLFERGRHGAELTPFGERFLPDAQALVRDANEIVAEIAPQPQDIVVKKQKPSGFFGSNLISYLNLLQCDSLIVAGTTTSGCVRATVIDAFSYNIRVAVVEDGCFDRSEASHAIALCDMHAKYADIVPAAKVKNFIATLPGDLFPNLPPSG